MTVRLVQEYRLEDMVLVRYRRFIGIVIHPELMLVICAIECHLDFVWVFRVAVRVVHGSVAGGFVFRPRFFVLGEGDLVFLLFGFWFGAKFGFEMCFEVLLEVVAVGMCDCDIVEETCAAEHEFLFPGGGFSEELLGVVGKDAEDHVVECFCGGGWAGMFAAAEFVDTFFALGVEGAGL